MKEYIIVDRIEGNYIICEREDGTYETFGKELLPVGIKEGDFLIKVKEEWKIDKEEKEKQLKEIKGYLETFFKKN